MSRDEVHEVSNAVMSFLGMHIQLDVDYLMKVDENGDESVSREEFVKALTENEFLDRVMVPF